MLKLNHYCFSALLVFVCFCTTSCKRQNDYKQASIDYLKTKVINPASLDTVSFGKPDSVFTTFLETSEYKALRKKVDSLEELTDGYMEKSKNSDNLEVVRGYSALFDADNKEALRLLAVMSNRMDTYPGQLKGWDVKVAYRSKDGEGRLKADTAWLHFNKDFSHIEGATGIEL